MAVISKYKLNGVQSTPPREWRNLEIEATFENDSVQADININTINLVNEANEIVKNWIASNKILEGLPIDIEISDNNNNINAFNGYLDFRNYIEKSNVECEISIIKSNGLNSLSDRSKGITMLLLQQKGIMPTSDGVNIPFAIRNRKTFLEKIQWGIIAFTTVKAIFDEIFKLIAIAADITSAGVVQALINLALTITNLIILINKLIDLIKEYMTTYYPLLQNHRAIKLKTFIERGCQYLGYNVDFGNINNVISGVVLMPNKDDEDSVGFGNLYNSSTGSNISGILKPNNYGYTLFEAFDLTKRMFNTKIAVVGNTVQVRSKNDPYWTTQSGYNLPNVLIEQAFVDNGSKSYNLDEIVGRTLIEFDTDNSDLWTITQINDSIAEAIIDVPNFTNQKNILLNGYNYIKIPYALCTRINENGKIYDLIDNAINGINNTIDSINDEFDNIASIFGDNASLDPLPHVNNILTDLRGALQIENQFFDKPKILYINDFGFIPANFKDIIGAKALYTNYHSYNSIVPGVRNPNDLTDTNQKTIYRGVKVPFGINEFNTIINNSFFVYNGKNAKFEKIKWNIDGDYAIIDFWVNEIYTTNLTETLL